MRKKKVSAAPVLKYTMVCSLEVQIDHRGTKVQFEPFFLEVDSAVPPMCDGALYIGLHRFLVESVAMGKNPELVISLEDLDLERELGPDGIAELVRVATGRPLVRCSSLKRPPFSSPSDHESGSEQAQE